MKTCLIADASEVIRKVARFHLESAGVKVFDAGDAENSPQDLPRGASRRHAARLEATGMTTTAFLSALRFSGLKQRLKVVYVATENDPQEISRALAAGAQSYMLKPFDKSGLMKKGPRVRTRHPCLAPHLSPVHPAALAIFPCT